MSLSLETPRAAPRFVANRNLPKPRLEMRWVVIDSERRNAEFWLVMPAHKFDIRCNTEYKKDGEFRRLLEKVECSGSPVGPGTAWSEWPLHRDAQSITTPFRLAAHMQWDAFALKLPCFIVHGRRAQIVEPHDPAPDVAAVNAVVKEVSP